MPAEGGQGGTMGKLKGIGVMTWWNTSIHAWAINGILPMINKTQIVYETCGSLLIPVLHYCSLLSGVLKSHMSFQIGMPMPGKSCHTPHMT